MRYYIILPPWSQVTEPGEDSFYNFSQYVGQLEGYEVGLFRNSAHENESDKPYQSNLIQNFEFERGA